ncbi:DMT family transporter [Cupriavidus malaysiensis]|uniref:EamA domain-containing protein n=1 Tax=Cupriavidus malaysiensis TaxID=367825 RepID=A0ABN4TXW8_9BURK|nr:DMT family transporter [Cupriavidus malaysiensis]AOZ09379.1 hypothetical protein BKK80_26740 [Cupriavidus malaysiensis]
MPQRSLGHACLALAMVMVGSTVAGSKIIAAGLPPFTATALRFAMALPCFLLLMRLTRSPWPRPDRHDLALLWLQAAAGSVGYTTLLIAGLRLTPAADAGVIIGTLPVVSAAIAMLLLRERPGPRLLLAIALATAGVGAITFAPGTGGSPAGRLLVLAAVVCEGLFILLNRRLRQPVAPLALSTLMSAQGLAVCLLPAGLETWPASWPAPALAAVAWYALGPTVCGFLLWYAGSARTSASEAALFTALAPVSAVLLAFAWLGEPLRWIQLAGVGCVLLAVLSLVLAPRVASGRPRPESSIR